jgi:hypothetical protein
VASKGRTPQAAPASLPLLHQQHPSSLVAPSQVCLLGCTLLWLHHRSQQRLWLCGYQLVVTVVSHKTCRLSNALHSISLVG